MLPPLPRFFLRMQLGVTCQRSCKKIGEEGRGEGARFCTLYPRPPSSCLTATFSPRGQKVLRSRGKH